MVTGNPRVTLCCPIPQPHLYPYPLHRFGVVLGYGYGFYRGQRGQKPVKGRQKGWHLIGIVLVHCRLVICYINLLWMVPRGRGKGKREGGSEGGWEEGRVWAVSRGGSGGQWGRGGCEGGGGSGGPDLLYPALKQQHYHFRRWSASYGCHVTDWCTSRHLLATRSCCDGHLSLSMVSVGTHGWS